MLSMKMFLSSSLLSGSKHVLPKAATNRNHGELKENPEPVFFQKDPGSYFHLLIILICGQIFLTVFSFGLFYLIIIYQ